MSEFNHKEHHAKLHKSLFEITRDWISTTHNLPSMTTVEELVRWAFRQKIKPDDEFNHADSDGADFNHAERHKKLHKDLIELSTDWAVVTGKDYSTITVSALIIWSVEQSFEINHEQINHKE